MADLENLPRGDARLAAGELPGRVPRAAGQRRGPRSAAGNASFKTPAHKRGSDVMRARGWNRAAVGPPNTAAAVLTARRRKILASQLRRIDAQMPLSFLRSLDARPGAAAGSAPRTRSASCPRSCAVADPLVRPGPAGRRVPTWPTSRPARWTRGTTGSSRQKIWTSSPHKAELDLCLIRTDPRRRASGHLPSCCSTWPRPACRPSRSS